MNIMEAMMERMMGRMSKDDKAEMMDKMMAGFFEGMTKEEKQKMMQDMMPKMMEGMTMMDMMKGMMGGGQEGQDDMMGFASGMMGDGCKEGAMPHMVQMMENMMPHCLEMMLPQVPKAARGDFAAKLLKALVDNGAAGMTEEEKKEYLARTAEAIQTQAKTG
jgi:hypothetical protein